MEKAMSKDVFKRVEYKYLMSKEVYQSLLKLILLHLEEDQYGPTTIQSLYFDTPTNRLIRNSIDKPLYKEKIRLRSYGLCTSSSNVFLELKKKSSGIVFKRRIKIKEKEAFNFLIGRIKPNDSQITNEIDYFVSFYGTLNPSFLILYDRTAYLEKGTTLRITFDQNIRYRRKELNLHTSLDGTLISSVKGMVLMEVKTDTALPLWLVKFLNENKIYKKSFSKYGEAYKLETLKNKMEVFNG